jgi:hypothetical protein
MSALEDKLAPPSVSAANSDRPRASLAALKNRYGYRDDGSKRPQFVTIEGPKRERWERTSGDMFVMTEP